ncbi:MAG TPA: GNAT family N-acetyltransferase [Candidatus Baltobacteraceae bacterium]|jgi:ribosomal-protein-alanine N-acetyltransferase|nr:GNAT family N-acetyltransferase [Candidatus Baltobacteraceae bacterium]
MRTERLRLTPVTVQNSGTLWHVLQQPDLRMYQELPSVGAPAFADMVSKRPKSLRAGVSGRFEWLVYLHRVRKPVGWVSLRVAERDLTTGEIGYSIVRDFRGRGVATEAVRALLDEAFTEGGLTRINAYCLPENMPSRRLLERLAFSPEGTLPRGATVNGQIVDVLMHKMDRDRWFQSGNSIVMPASAYPA